MIRFLSLLLLLCAVGTAQADQIITVNQTAQALVFGPIVSSVDSKTAVTGLVSGSTMTVTISKNGGAFATPTGAVSQVGKGYYAIAGNATDAASVGRLIISWDATAGGGNINETYIQVNAVDLQNATSAGLTNLDATVSSRSTFAGGAVASVTGNVGGNIVGSVASVTAPVQIDLTQTLTGSGGWTGVNLLSVFQSAWASILGKQVADGTGFKVYAPDATTILKAWTLTPTLTSTQFSTRSN